MKEITIEIFNETLVTEVEPTFNISFTDIEDAYKKLFSDYDIENINIVFVKPDYIKELNRRYREIDAPTDVLSFEIEKGKGEIYICPEFVYESFRENEYEEEILRLVIHGTLHILGYDHLESMNDSPQEEMFKIQEELLLKFKKLCS
jgi:probable rRNA maturation factor